MEYFKQPKTIVVAVDKDKGSEEAFQLLLKVVRPEVDRVVLVHSVPGKVQEPDPNTSSVPVMEYYTYHQKPWQEIEEQYTKEIFAKYSGMAKGAGLNFTVEEVEGETRHALTKKATDVNADIIIVGNRGRSVVAGLMLGSVSEYLVHHAPCAVLIARRPEDRKVEE